MRRILITFILLLIFANVSKAQIGNASEIIDPTTGMIVDDPDRDPLLVNDSIEIISLPPTVYMWRIDPKFGNIRKIPADTLMYNFQNSNLMEGMEGEYNFLGNLGAPRYSRIFFNIPEASDYIFLDPYSAFYFDPDQFNFTNSNIPYSNVSYYKAGSKVNGEERFKAYFSVNVNKRFAFGFNFDYLYGRGMYASQGTGFFNATLFGSYIGDRYQMHAMYSNFSFKMAENGGITNDLYITRPEEMSEGKKSYEPANIPTVMTDTWNRNHKVYGYLTHRYNLGFEREIISEKTEKEFEFVPVTSFIHTFKVERARRRYITHVEPEFKRDETTPYYSNTYLNFEFEGTDKLSAGFSNDSTVYFSVKNLIGISLIEGFNRYAKAGLTAYLTHDYRKYTLLNEEDELEIPHDQYTEHEVFAGGRLTKEQGNLLHYNATGEIGLAGKALGQFRVYGDVDLNFKLGKDTVSFIGRGRITNTLPSFYMRHYHSNHFWWDNDFDKEFRTRIEGELAINRWRSRLRAGVENIKNYTYFNQEALPTQHSGNIQVLSGIFNQDFKLGILHLDNEVVYQKSSSNTVLPLPQLSLYHNLYIQTKLAKGVLSLQLGADVRYFSEYYAPTYTPAIGQFNLQAEDDEKVKIGGYPFVNVYANLHLKRTRLFVMMYHVNQGMGNAQSFLTPHYPINPRMFKFGLSWNFYD